MSIFALISLIVFCSADDELSKVRSEEKRAELFNILHSEDPDHYSRLWLVGFLKFVGYSLYEVCAIIESEACWRDYDARMTWCQVKGMFNRHNNTIPISTRLWEGSDSGGKPFHERVSFERKRPCAITWTPCKGCPDRDPVGGCSWVR